MSFRSRLRFIKWMRFLKWNCNVIFCWLWDFLLENMKLKKILIMSTGMLEMIFQKRNSKYDILNHLYFGPKFIFSGHRFAWVFFCKFLSLVNHGGRHFYSAPHHEKASDGPGKLSTLKSMSKIVIHEENKPYHTVHYLI